MKISNQQLHFFQTFGYLAFPALFREDIEHITSEFRAVFDDRGVAHDASRRTCMIPFIDQRDALCALLDDPRILEIGQRLLGPDFNYLGSDGNYYTGDTGWHTDSSWQPDGSPHTKHGVFLKIAFYLDPVTRDTGALRVIPGSHRPEALHWPALRAGHAQKLWGIEPGEVPSVALESSPGDVLVFDHNLMHGSFGGNAQRRMFTLNLSEHAESPEAISELEGFIGLAARFWIDSLYSDLMRSEAHPARMRHLRQVMEHEKHLPILAAKARAEMAEPARS